jgi:hypothetical protein
MTLRPTLADLSEGRVIKASAASAWLHRWYVVSRIHQIESVAWFIVDKEEKGIVIRLHELLDITKPKPQDTA